MVIHRLFAVLAFSFSAAAVVASPPEPESAWQLHWQPAKPLNQWLGAPQTAQWQIDPKAILQFQLTIPTVITQMHIANHMLVSQHQSLLVLAGGDLLNLETELEIAHEHQKAAETRLVRNQQRFEQGDISLSTWQEWRHEAHLMSMQARAKEFQWQQLKQWQLESVTGGYQIKAPVAGIIQLDPELQTGADWPASTSLLRLLPMQSLQIEFRLPLSNNASALKLGGCTVPVTKSQATVDAQQITYRSVSINQWQGADCQTWLEQHPAHLGQRFSIEPVFAESAMEIPIDSLIQHADTDGVIINQAAPTVVPVTVLGRTATSAFIRATPALVNTELASGDVAALLGQLQGLGAE